MKWNQIKTKSMTLITLATIDTKESNRPSSTNHIGSNRIFQWSIYCISLWNAKSRSCRCWLICSEMNERSFISTVPVLNTCTRSLVLALDYPRHVVQFGSQRQQSHCSLTFRDNMTWWWLSRRGCCALLSSCFNLVCMVPQNSAYVPVCLARHFLRKNRDQWRFPFTNVIRYMF